MNTKPENLVDQGYVLIDSLDHKELVPFVSMYLKKKTRISTIYTAFNIVFIGLVYYWFWVNYGSPNFKVMNGVSYFSYGMAIAFLLIPIHEYIHVLAYKSQGAEHTSYDVNWKKFYFMALADKFVANKKEFRIVALAPFTFISGISLCLLFVASPLWTFTILGVLITHTMFSSGDFGLLSYVDFHKNKEIVTYDDIENKVTYFYGKDK